MQPLLEERVAKTNWPDDAELVGRCLAGEGDAWSELLKRYRRLIYSIPVAYGFSEDDADEVFQRVAVKLLDGLARLRDVGALTSWLATVARHECHSLHREGSRHDSTPVEELDPPAPPDGDIAERLEAVEQEQQIALALERLGGPCRELLHALYVEDPTPPYEEISRRLKRPIGSLGPTRSRCLGKLRTLYHQLGGAGR